MKERLLDIIKWGLIIIIAGAVYYAVSPKYFFMIDRGRTYKCNKLTGHVWCWYYRGDEWIELKEAIARSKGKPEVSQKEGFVFEGQSKDEKSEQKP
jgi:hypothetical protein